ncbi:MAG: pilus assembly protein [Pirellulaceae bacterium]|nr:pilus assembly protein [Pirellulaceae bacterium]
MKRHLFRSGSPSKRRGAAAVEFAITVSILLMIVFAMIEFVRLSIVSHTVEDASYAGARAGIIYGATVAEVENAVQNHLAIFDISNAVITVTPDPIDDDAQIVTVNVDAPIAQNTWITPAFFGGTVSGQTRMLAERSADKMRAASANATAPPPPPPI